jgi:hypothetical protein
MDNSINLPGRSTTLVKLEARQAQGAIYMTGKGTEGTIGRSLQRIVVAADDGGGRILISHGHQLGFDFMRIVS